jgi:hypothetical protein
VSWVAQKSKTKVVLGSRVKVQWAKSALTQGGVSDCWKEGVVTFVGKSVTVNLEGGGVVPLPSSGFLLYVQDAADTSPFRY